MAAPVVDEVEEATGDKTLADLVSIDVLQKVQDNFSKAVGVAMVIVDPDGVPLTHPSGFSAFCRTIRRIEKWRALCFNCDNAGGRMAQTAGQPSIYRCHCGLVDFAAPILMRGRYLGAVICGQVNLKPDEDRARLDDMSSMFQVDDSWRDDPKLLILHQETGEISYDRLRSAAYCLFYIASHLAEESYANAITKELYAKNLNLMQESQRRVELEKSLREAELQALSYQVNPHFLFNVLNTIGRLALVEGAEETEKLVYAFADMMRYILKKSGSQIVPLQTEIEHVSNYLYILKQRLGDRFTFRLEVPDKFQNVQCPFMVLQPIVENCINYAIEPKAQDGLLDIIGYEDQGDVVLDVIDNGEGIPPNRKRDALNGVADHGGRTSIGLHNVDSRLRHYFGEDHGLEVISPYLKGGGTLVRMRFPLEFDPCGL